MSTDLSADRSQNKNRADKKLKKISNASKRVCWEFDNISKVILLYSLGPRVYRLLLKQIYFTSPLHIKKVGQQNRLIYWVVQGCIKINRK